MVQRVLIAKPGLDGHDRGAKILAHYLQSRGFEVIYTGLHQTPAKIVMAAIQEDVDVICISILSGAHLMVAEKVMALLKEKGAEDIPVLMGGVIPEKDIASLKRLGIKGVFTAKHSLEEIVDFIRSLGKEG